tara:strand:+ start:31416 stop:32528 length:1113 start_codon:yes stop_codon:yes gene_type:complete
VISGIKKSLVFRRSLEDDGAVSIKDDMKMLRLVPSSQALKSSVSLCLVLTSSSVLAELPQAYTVKDIGSLGGYSVPHSIDESGRITGYSYTAAGVRAFSWTQTGGMVNLGSLGNDKSIAYDSNETGEVVGTSIVNGQYRGFIWRADTGMTAVPCPPAATCSARGINSEGVVTGYTQIPGGPYRPFRWSGGDSLDYLPTLGGAHAYGAGINADGSVTGVAYTADPLPHAFVSDEAGQLRDLGSLDGSTSYGKAINSLGHAVGYGADRGNKGAFFWSPELGMVALGTLGGPNSYAKGINSEDVVVGQSQTGARATGFVWTAATGMLDLNQMLLGEEVWFITAALDVNDSGQITGFGKDSRGRIRTLLLNPVY